MSLENDFLKDLDGRDPDGFVYSLDRRNLTQRIKEFIASLSKARTDFRSLPYDVLGEEDEEH
jgi:hypothetical protein